MAQSSKIKIDKFEIGRYGTPFIIAEAGINHNGEIEKSFRMIEVAKWARADAIKFQTFKAEEFCGDENQQYTYFSQGSQITESMLAMFKRCEFSRDEWLQIKQKCDDEDILFLSTPQNQSDLDLLIEIGVPAVKVGSDDFTNLPLLKDYARTQLPMIISCGMADLADVHNALDTIGALDGYPTVLLLCTSEYPTPSEHINLLKLQTLADAFPDLVLGFSDHTQGELAASIAVGFGASCFEKHFTLNNDLPGPDHWFSASPRKLRRWANSIHTAHLMLGSAAVRPTHSELEMRTTARRSIVALQNIQRGEKLTQKNIGLRRPGNGLSPALFETVLNYSASRNLKRGSVLELGDFQ